MLDQRLLITIKKIGQEIENANELDADMINIIAKDIPEWQEYSDGCDEEFLLNEEIYDNSSWVNEKNEIVFTLKDNSTWRYIRNNYKCILHSYSDYNNLIGETVFQSLDNDKLYKCADCGAFLKSHDDILYEYYPSHDDWLLFPIDWTDAGIIAWCKKREEKQQKYEAEREERYERRREDYYNSMDKDCSNCCHMKHGECEYGNCGCESDDIDEDTECEDWEEN